MSRSCYDIPIEEAIEINKKAEDSRKNKRKIEKIEERILEYAKQTAKGYNLLSAMELLFGDYVNKEDLVTAFNNLIENKKIIVYGGECFAIRNTRRTPKEWEEKIEKIGE